MFDEITDLLTYGELEIAFDKINELNNVYIDGKQKLQLNLCRIEIFILRGDFPKAIELLGELENKIDKQDTFLYLRFYNLYIEALAKNGNSMQSFKELVAFLGKKDELKELAIITTNEIKTELAKMFIKFGTSSVYMGNVDDGENYYKQSLTWYKETGYLQGIVASLMNIGEINRYRGLLDEAYHYYSSCLKLDSITRVRNYPGILVNLGELEFSRANYEKALDYFVSALKKFRKIGNSLDIAECILSIIKTKHFLTKDCSQELNELKELNIDSGNNKLIQYIYSLGQALHELEIGRLPNLINAQEILQSLKREHIMINEVEIFVNRELAKINLIELQINQSEETWLNLNNLLDEIDYLATKNKLYPDLIENMILKAKLNFLQNKLKEGLAILEEAKKVAKEKKLTGLLQNVEREEKFYLTKIATLKPNQTLQQKLDLMDMKEYIGDLNKIVSSKN